MRHAPRRSLLVTSVFALVAATFVVGAGPVPPTTTAGGPERAAGSADPGRFSPVEEHEPSTADRYTLAGGCFSLVGDDGDALRRDADGFTARATEEAATAFHLEPTDLGRYLIVSTDERFLAASEGRLGEALDAASGGSAAAMADGATAGNLGRASDELERSPVNRTTGRGQEVVAAPSPSDLADWSVIEVAGGFRLELEVLDAALGRTEEGELTLVEAGDPDAASTTFAFVPTEGCMNWPEVEINVDGEVVGGRTAVEATRGYLDAHTHLTGFERAGGRARCGRPWHRFGVAHALRGCPEHEDTGGRTHLLATVLSGRDPVTGHDTDGWPTFTDWPAHDALLYEQAYHRWLERAWRGGLRLTVNLLVENEQLCTAYPFRSGSCNEMDSARRQAKRTYELERYIDAQHGGPGKGWFRVVDDPFEARRVINEGRLAVVLGIEASRLFDCRSLRGEPTCDEAQIDAQLEEMHGLGVRYLLLTNWYDNALTGVMGHGGEQGLAVNAGNFAETGRFWQMERCDEHARGHDSTVHNPGDHTHLPVEPLYDAFGVTGGHGAAPLYPPGPHCNTEGLTDLGEHLLQRIVERGMIFDPDHMSARARHRALDILEAADYSGVVSSHSWADDDVYRRVLQLGGVVTPSASDAPVFVETWRRQRQWADERYVYGFGVGSDVHGFAEQGGPRGEDAADAVEYPFEGFGGVEIDRQVSGQRTFDVNTDGVAHYGLYPDWFEDLRRLAGEEITADLERGPEAFLQMWERAEGIGGNGCRPDVEAPSRADLRALPRGTEAEAVLRVLGQPHERDGDVFGYCTSDGPGGRIHFEDGRLHRVTFARGR